jgi:hypothetical protein
MSRKTLLIALCLGAALSACATRDPMTAPPDWMDIRILEELRVLTPMASATATAGEFIVTSAPKVETRNVRCTPEADGFYTCAFETRVKPAGGKPGPWEKRSELMERDGRGNWWFARTSGSESGAQSGPG